jgi:hypothetical protein
MKSRQLELDFNEVEEEDDELWRRREKSLDYYLKLFRDRRSGKTKKEATCA